MISKRTQEDSLKNFKNFGSKMDSNKKLVTIDCCNDICKCLRPHKGLQKLMEQLKEPSSKVLHTLQKNLVQRVNMLIILNKKIFFEKFQTIVKIIKY